MITSAQQTTTIWVAIGIGGVSLVVLVIGLSLLLGTLRHRKVGLPMIWISSAVLIAVLVGLTLILTNSR